MCDRKYIHAFYLWRRSEQWKSKSQKSKHLKEITGKEYREELHTNFETTLVFIRILHICDRHLPYLDRNTWKSEGSCSTEKRDSGRLKAFEIDIPLIEKKLPPSHPGYNRGSNMEGIDNKRVPESEINYYGRSLQNCKS